MAKNGSTTKTAVKKVVKLAPRAAKPAAAAKAPKVAKAPKATSGKFIGKTTGLRVQAFQDKLMKDNYKAKLSDAALIKAMRAEFPGAVTFNEGHVAGIRSQWNNGKRTSQEGAAPARRLARFDDNGEEINSRAGRKAGADKGVVKKGAAKKAAKTAPPADEEDADEEDAEEDDDDEDTDDEE